MRELVRYATVRLSNAITSKHKKFLDDYQRLPHVQGKPFVVCVAPFEQPGAFMQNTAGILAVLYGVDKPLYLDDDSGNRTFVGESLLEVVDKDNGALVPVGLFKTDAYKSISAVLFSSTATWGKVQALASFEDPTLVFFTMRYDPDSTKPRIEQIPKALYSESLCDGLHLFLNPFAVAGFNLAPFLEAGICICGVDPDSGMLSFSDNAGFLIQRMLGRDIPPALAEALRVGPPVVPYKQTAAPAWKEGELRSTGSHAGMYTDNHLAHYKEWTILVCFDSVDEEWMVQARKSTFRTVSEFTTHRTDENDFILPDAYRSKGSAAVAAYTRIDLIILGLADSR